MLNIIILFSFIIISYLIYMICNNNFNIYQSYNSSELKFVHYKSSKLEIEWMNVIKNNEHDYYKKYCTLLSPFRSRLEILERDIYECKWKRNERCEGNDLSVFIYQYKNGTILKEYIEPLFGILRNTFSVCNIRKKGNILSKDYLLPSYLLALKEPIVYIDAGASTFNGGEGGASQNYFYEYYKKNSSIYKDWFLWEVTKQNISKIYSEIPKDLIRKYHYYNKPIEVDIESKDNPLFLIKKYQLSYYIIFKIDVDNNNVEMPIFNHLLEYDDILPDEFYFEYHYYSPYMMKWWNKDIDYNCSLYCAINKFLLLRKKGIRSHPWV